MRQIFASNGAKVVGCNSAMCEREVGEFIAPSEGGGE